jgi:diadenosine tetraphosphate (Ap4A) HIT family hydrolase
MSNQANCPFCHLGERIIKRNDLATLFLSNPRKVPGHILVVPNRHVERPWGLSKEELLAVFELIYWAEQKITASLAPGFDLRENYRPFLEQSQLKIDHIHYHVIPRGNLDRIYEVNEKHDIKLFQPLSDGEREEITKLLG